MTRKRWCLITGALLIALLAAIALLVVIVDPFEIYHRALFYNPAYKSDTQMYAQAGVARSYTYDSIIIGSSVTENCTPSVYDTALGGRFVKLSMNAGTALDHAKIMDIALRTHNVRRVVYGLDLFGYSVYHTNQKAETPDYLYDDNLFNDVYYLLNKTVLLKEIPKALSRISAPDEDKTRDSMYAWTPPSLPSESGLREQLDLTALPEQADIARGIELAQLNLDHNLLPYIRKHRDTTFTIFFPPYCALYWAQQAQDGMLDTCMAQRQLIAEALLAEPNVELYDFQTHVDWTENYDLYFDLIHYIASVNDDMASAMAAGLCRVTDLAQIEAGNQALLAHTHALFENAPN